MELIFILIAIGIFVFGIAIGLAIDSMCNRTRKVPAPLLGVVLPKEEKK